MISPDINFRLPEGARFRLDAVRGGRFGLRADNAGAALEIFDVIGADVTAARVTSALRELGPRPVRVEVNSPGGDFFEGLAIYNALKAHRGRVTVEVLGVAASAASVVAMAGDEIRMPRAAYLMIHKCWALVIGDAGTMDEAGRLFRRFDATAAALYAERSGQPADRMLDLMAAETWLDGAEAVALGLATELLDRDADPKPVTVPADAPESARDLEICLRNVGLARAAAKRIAAGGWPALTGDDKEAEQLAARIAAASANFAEGAKRWNTSR